MPFKDVPVLVDRARERAARVDPASRDLDIHVTGAHVDGWFALVSH